MPPAPAPSPATPAPTTTSAVKPSTSRRDDSDATVAAASIVLELTQASVDHSVDSVAAKQQQLERALVEQEEAAEQCSTQAVATFESVTGPSPVVDVAYTALVTPVVEGIALTGALLLLYSVPICTVVVDGDG